MKLESSHNCSGGKQTEGSLLDEECRGNSNRRGPPARASLCSGPSTAPLTAVCCPHFISGHRQVPESGSGPKELEELLPPRKAFAPLQSWSLAPYPSHRRDLFARNAGLGLLRCRQWNFLPHEWPLGQSVLRSSKNIILLLSLLGSAPALSSDPRST